MSMPHTCKCGTCGATMSQFPSAPLEMGVMQSPSLCWCIGGYCALENGQTMTQPCRKACAALGIGAKVGGGK